MAMYRCDSCDEMKDDDCDPMDAKRQCGSCHENNCAYCGEQINDEPEKEESGDFYHAECWPSAYRAMIVDNEIPK